MIEFIAGLFLGAVLGVVANRAWERFEKRLRLELTIGDFRNPKGEEGLTYRVRNVGAVEIRQIRIGVLHPSRGIMSAFYAEDNGSLLPDQTREYQCTLFKNGAPATFLKYWITHEGGEFVAEPKFKQFKLLVYMENSERVSFESTKMGGALAKAWHRALVLNQPAILTPADRTAMSSPRRWGVEYWLERRRKKNSRHTVVEHEKHQDNKDLPAGPGANALE